jgi:hypothetical protein
VLAAPETVIVDKAVATVDLCDSLKQEHNMAKAVKVDEAAVPVHLWDKVSFRGPPSLVEKKALMTMQDRVLRKYRLHLWGDAR